MGLLSRIFGTEKALNGAVSAVTKGLDALVYTDEEKAQTAAKERAAGREMVIKWMENTQGQNLARRAIALTVTAIWAVQYVAAMLLNALAAAMPEHASLLSSVASAIREGGEQVTGAMMLVLGFYFAAPHLGTIVGGAMDKFKGAPKKP